MRSSWGPEPLGDKTPFWQAPWPPFCPPNDPKGGQRNSKSPKWSQRDLKWSQMEPKRCQISVKINVKISINFNIPFYTKNVPKRMQK